MNESQMYSVLKMANVQELYVQGRVSNLALMQTVDEAEYVRVLQRSLSQQFATKFADDVLSHADWHCRQHEDGMHFEVIAFVVTQQKMLDLLRYAYAEGRKDGTPAVTWKEFP